MKKHTLPVLLCDFYKTAHRVQYPEGTEFVYSTWTPRATYIEGVTHAVAFGNQGFVKEYLIDYFNEHFFSRPKQEVIDEYVRFIKYTLFVENPEYQHIADLHDLGYLPLHIKSVKEGTLVPLRVPMTTVVNTNPKFFWLTNYLETLFSSQNWLPSTSATIAFEYKKLLVEYAKKTGGSLEFVNFQGHDFSERGMVNEAGTLSGAGHLTSFLGTDTIPAIPYLEQYYNANIEKELVGTSVPATEHSVMCAGGQENEFDTYDRLINKVHPTGIVSIVSDTWDLWKVITDTLVKLKDSIMNRDGKVVIRPDSGDPVKILCGDTIPDLTTKCDTLEDCKAYMEDELVEQIRDETPHGEHGDSYAEGMFKFQDKYYTVEVEIDWNRYDKQYYYIDGTRVSKFNETIPTPDQIGVVELLWDIFGGTVNEKGYKELDPHIGAIYGDSITVARAKAISEGLMAKGFASTNVVYGIGSFTYQYQTRDSLGFAMKATHVVINGEERSIQKDPATDKNKTKKSATGRIAVTKVNGELVMNDGLTIEQQDSFSNIDLLEDVFVNGKLVRDQSLAEIRELIAQNIK